MTSVETIALIIGIGNTILIIGAIFYIIKQLVKQHREEKKESEETNEELEKIIEQR